MTQRCRHLASFAVYALAFAFLDVFAVWTRAGQRLDASTLGGLPALSTPFWLDVYGVRDILPVALCALAVLLAIVSLIQHRVVDAVGAGALILAVFAATRVLDAMPRPELGPHGYSVNTFPSGHVAVALAGALACAWLWPARLDRRLIAIPAVLAFIVAVASMLSLAHRGADIVGGILLVGALGSVVEAVLGSRGRGVGSSTMRLIAFGLITLGLVVAGAAVVAAPSSGAAATLAALLSAASIQCVILPLEGRSGRSGASLRGGSPGESQV